MIDPSPVMVRAMTPISRRTFLSAKARPNQKKHYLHDDHRVG
jgi:hypothetical protein